MLRECEALRELNVEYLEFRESDGDVLYGWSIIQLLNMKNSVIKSKFKTTSMEQFKVIGIP